MTMGRSPAKAVLDDLDNLKLRLAQEIHQAQGGNWDGLEPDCDNPKNCRDGMPYRMHRGYWIELAEKKLRLN